MKAFPVRGKKKSVDLCEAFVAGSLGRAARDAAVFYGIDDSNETEFRTVIASGREWYYIDNSYFDVTRGTHFRVTRNGIQHSGLGETNGERFKALGVDIKPWRVDGKHIVVCPQSDDFMSRIIRYRGSWIDSTLIALRAKTPRTLRVRDWNRDKTAAAATLGDDLRGAWMLVTHSSAAAITALLYGIPVVSHAGAAKCMSSNMNDVEHPFFPKDRERFFGVLADNQWTPTELANGAAWNAISSTN